MKVFQNNYFLSCGLLINVTYLYAKMQDNFFLLYIFAILSFFPNVVAISARDHMEVLFYFKCAYLKAYINAFEKILSFWHWIILSLKHFI